MAEAASGPIAVATSGTTPVVDVLNPGFLGFPGWDTGYRAKIKTVGSAPLSVMHIGHSIAFGEEAGDTMGQGYGFLFRSAAMAKYGAFGDFWSAGLQTSINGSVSSFFPYTFSGTGTSAQEDGQGYGQGYAPSGFGTSHDVTFDPTKLGAPGSAGALAYNFTAMDILACHFNASGTWTWAVDGGAPTTVTNTSNDGLLTRIPLTGLSSGQHTLTFSSFSAQTAMVLAGVATYTGAAGGFAYANVAQPGQTAAAALQGAPLTNIQGYQSAGSPTGFGYPAGPDLALIEFGVNDLSQFKTPFADPGSFGILLRQLIAALRRANPTVSIVLVSSWCGPGGNYTDDSGFGQSAVWHLYEDEMQKAAQRAGLGILSLEQRWGSTPVAQGFISAGTAHHPTTAGHADIFNALWTELS